MKNLENAIYSAKGEYTNLSYTAFKLAIALSPSVSIKGKGISKEEVHNVFKCLNSLGYTPNFNTLKQLLGELNGSVKRDKLKVSPYSTSYQNKINSLLTQFGLAKVY
jgi:hypothetical protein